MPYLLLPRYFEMLKEHSANFIFKPEYFEEIISKVLDVAIR